MRTLELIRQLDDRAFAMLCSVLLKAEISPRVRLVSAAGSDGGRDAWYEGESASYPGWSGKWLFQFKHYRFDVTSAQRRILRELEAGVISSHQRYPDLNNYFLVTSVPFSGVPERGTFDRVRAKVQELEAKTGLRVEVWDGLEVASQAALHRVAYELAAPRLPREVEPAGILGFGMSARLLRDFTDEALTRHVILMIATAGDPLGPGEDTPVSQAIYDAQFPALQEVLLPVLAEVTSRSRRGKIGPELAYWTEWMSLALALAQVRMGAVRPAIRRVLGLSRRLDGPAERAWAWNILSLGYGKMENDRRYASATASAIAFAREAGNFWLEVTIRMRALHKIDWAAGEAGLSAGDQEFLDALFGATVRDGERNLTPLEIAHLHGQQQVYLALHHRWAAAKSDQARTALKAATGFFEEAGDSSELTRIGAEEGQLARIESATTEAPLLLLQKAFRQRLAAGELSRGRYDLLYLAEAHAERGSLLEAEACASFGLALHKRLFGDRKVDTRLVDKLNRVTRVCGSSLHRRVHMERVTEDMLFDVVMRATGLTEVDMLRSADVPGLLNEMKTTHID